MADLNEIQGEGSFVSGGIQYGLNSNEVQKSGGLGYVAKQRNNNNNFVGT